MRGPSVLLRLQLAHSLVLLELALPRLDVLVPNMGWRYALGGLASQAEARFTDGAQDDIIIVDCIRIVTLAVMVVWAPVIRTKYVFAKIASKRQEILLLAVLHGAMAS